MHYMRFLKAPKIETKTSRVNVKTLITITNDLGDDFLTAELPIYAFIMPEDVGANLKDKPFIVKSDSLWRHGLRSLWLTISDLPKSAFKTPVRLLISTKSEYEKTPQVPHDSLNSLSNVLEAWSEPFSMEANQKMKWVERRFTISEAATLRICEELGESIARHIWDAGVVLAVFFSDIVKLPHSPHDVSELAKRLQRSTGPRIIELGSGCGIVGLQLAQLCSKAQVVLTDLPEAMEILDQNISLASLASESRVSKAELNWDEDLPRHIREQTYDVVAVSDCTYNADSIPALVQTLARLIEQSPEALIVVAMKVRHTSEAIFHELMVKTKLRECSQRTIETPSALDESLGLDNEKVDIYTYKRCPA